MTSFNLLYLTLNSPDIVNSFSAFSCSPIIPSSLKEAIKQALLSDSENEYLSLKFKLIEPPSDTHSNTLTFPSERNILSNFMEVNIEEYSN